MVSSQDSLHASNSSGHGSAGLIHSHAQRPPDVVFSIMCGTLWDLHNFRKRVTEYVTGHISFILEQGSSVALLHLETAKTTGARRFTAVLDDLCSIRAKVNLRLHAMDVG